MKYLSTNYWVHFFAAGTLSFSGFVSLFIISFTESCCFIIPPDLFLPFLAFNKTFEYLLFIVLFTSFASVCGAAFGYFIGQKGGQPLLHKFFKKDKTDKVEHLFQQYDIWAIGIAAFTPIPYKVFTISAGVFNLHFIRFMLVSAIARTTRYMLIAFISFYFLNKLNMTPDEVELYLHGPQFKLLTIGIATGVILIYFIYRMIKKRGKNSAQPA
ncbi:MAG TPA: VTT domain-containing protein [bacterium]|nr:VTT domain-containing protein [bacterium]